MSISFEFIRLNLDERALDHMLNEPSGDVGRYLNRIGLVILSGAKVLVRVRTGALKRSLYMRHARDMRGQYVQVGSPLHYAYVQHEGSRPYTITPHRGRVLRFTNGGRVVYAQRVHHPGIRGTKYLTTPMQRAVRL